MEKERQLNDKEIKDLKKDLRNLDQRDAYQKRFLVGYTLVALIVGTIVYHRLDSRMEVYLLYGTVLVYILIGIWVYLENYVQAKKQRKDIDFALVSNKAKVIKVVSEEYMQLSEVEDEGVYYLFQLDDNKVLSFGGQDFYPTRKFPSNDFEIVLIHDEKGELLLLKKYVKGKKIQPKKKITRQKKWELLSSVNYPDPENFTVVNGRIEDYCEAVEGKIGDM
ncbi:hypothetical protein EYV94_04705 [Puteibacter caeruleilacunae]|nr:hypothetical protein EYV94_04705 [Puteibacter caeruleilacunae]